MSNERFEDIEATIKELGDKVTHLDKSFSEISISLKDYVGWVKQLEKTIRNLDDTVKIMGENHQQIPYDRLRAIQGHIDPIHDTLRRHESEFMSKKELTRMTAISVFFLSSLLVILGGFGGYVLNDVSEDILNAGSVNKSLIIGNSQAIEQHSKITGVVLDNMHKHSRGMSKDHSHDEDE